MEISESQELAVNIVLLIISVLSALGSFIMIVSLIIFRKLRKAYWRQVFMLALNDFIQALSMGAGAIAFLANDPFDEVLCIMQAITLHYTLLAGCMITMSLCFIFYFEANRGRKADWKLEVSLLVFSVALPTISTIIAIFVPEIDFKRSSSGWCLLASNFIARVFLIYFWAIVTIFVIISFYLLIWLKWRLQIRKAKKEFEEGETDSAYTSVKSKSIWKLALRLWLYPAAFIIVWAPALINRFYEGIHNEHIFGLVMTQTIADASIGFIDFLVYLVTMRAFLVAFIRNRGRKTKIDEIQLNYVPLENSKDRWKNDRAKAAQHITQSNTATKPALG